MADQRYNLVNKQRVERLQNTWANMPDYEFYNTTPSYSYLDPGISDVWAVASRPGWKAYGQRLAAQAAANNYPVMNYNNPWQVYGARWAGLAGQYYTPNAQQSGYGGAGVGNTGGAYVPPDEAARNKWLEDVTLYSVLKNVLGGGSENASASGSSSGAGTSFGAGAGAGSPGPSQGWSSDPIAQWVHEFTVQHGGVDPATYYGAGETKSPERAMAEALWDKKWGEQFYATYGRPPSEYDWQASYWDRERAKRAQLG